MIAWLAMVAVALVKEEGGEVWRRYDDDTVTVLEGGPASSWSDLGNAAPKKAGETGEPKVNFYNLGPCFKSGCLSL